LPVLVLERGLHGLHAARHRLHEAVRRDGHPDVRDGRRLRA
jgi:hypothetical protein